MICIHFTLAIIVFDKGLAHSNLNQDLFLTLAAVINSHTQNHLHVSVLGEDSDIIRGGPGGIADHV